MNDLTAQQTMLNLAFFADIDLNQSGGSKCADAHNAAVQIEKKLCDMAWGIAWGPAVYSFVAPGKDKERRFDNLVYVATNAANDYVVAIAGTNAKALLDWLLEDLAVHDMVQWPFGTSGDAGRISNATHTGLSILLSIMPCPGLRGAGQDLLEFLGSAAQGKAINVSTTGHSLGGALSPALALALVDQRGKWDKSGQSTVVPYAFAGATPGDAAFAAYFQSNFPNFVRVWNELDVVPHAWEVTELEEIPGLYGPPVAEVQDIVTKLVNKVKDDNYTQLGAGLTFRGPNPVQAPKDEKTFLAEAYTQHITAYLNWANPAG